MIGGWQPPEDKPIGDVPQFFISFSILTRIIHKLLKCIAVCEYGPAKAGRRKALGHPESIRDDLRP